MEEVYPKEFPSFYEAMSNEMRRHHGEYGESWKDVGFNKNVGARQSMWEWVDMEVHLDELLKKAVDEYHKTSSYDQLVDIANICAMIWCRKNE